MRIGHINRSGVEAENQACFNIQDQLVLGSGVLRGDLVILTDV